MPTQDDMVLNCYSCVVKNVNLSDAKALGVAAWRVVQVWGQTCWCRNHVKHMKKRVLAFFSLFWCVSTSDIYQQLIAAHANARWYGIELLFMCCQECEPIRCQSTWRGCMACCTSNAAKHVGAETMWNTVKKRVLAFFSLFWCVSTSDIYQQLIAAHANARWYGIELLFMRCQECEPIRCQSTWRGCMACCTSMGPNMLVPKYETMWNTWKTCFGIF